MNRKVIFWLITIVLIAIILFVRLYVDASSWMNLWGNYVFLVPTLYFLSSALTNGIFTYKILLAFSIGIMISVSLYRGDWSEGYVLYKIAATLAGTLIAMLIYSRVKQYR